MIGINERNLSEKIITSRLWKFIIFSQKLVFDSYQYNYSINIQINEKNIVFYQNWTSSFYRCFCQKTWSLRHTFSVFFLHQEFFWLLKTMSLTNGISGGIYFNGFGCLSGKWCAAERYIQCLPIWRWLRLMKILLLHIFFIRLITFFRGKWIKNQWIGDCVFMNILRF